VLDRLPASSRTKPFTPNRPVLEEARVILSLVMPRMGALMSAGMVASLHVTEGAELKPGARLLDVRVDLSAVAPQDCPPVYYFRVVSREKGWVRKLTASVGELKETGALLALVSTDPGEPLENPPARALRTTAAGIVREPDFQTGEPLL
jgi:pyruvate/2-oxoglutarate dehydrogenase complex dihydrolipoamide acyltransferase (E2) component